MTRTLTLLAALLAFPASAYIGGWDWDEEFQAREWRTASIAWANQIHPAHPPGAWLEDNEGPPSREMWCEHGYDDDPDDCDIFEDLLENWLRDYLNIRPGLPVPQYLFDGYPPECKSACYPE